MRLQLSLTLSAIPEDAIKWVGSTAFINVFVGSMHTPDKMGNHLYVCIDGYEKEDGSKAYIGIGHAVKRYSKPTSITSLIKTKRQFNHFKPLIGIKDKKKKK